MQILRRILREAKEALNKLNATKAKLTEEYTYQVELAEGQNIWTKKHKVVKGLAHEGREALRNIDKFLGSTLFPNYKKIAAADEGDAEEEEKTTAKITTSKTTPTTRPPRTKLRQKRRVLRQGDQGQDHHPFH